MLELKEGDNSRRIYGSVNFLYFFGLGYLGCGALGFRVFIGHCRGSELSSDVIVFLLQLD